MVIPLSQVPQGASCQIIWLASAPSMRQRLEDLGFAPGEVICCVLRPRKHGMVAYLVRSAVIALRPEQTKEIFVEPF